MIQCTMLSVSDMHFHIFSIGVWFWLLTAKNDFSSIYSDSIVIQPQQGQGKSNIVFSSSISISDVIKAASKLKSDLKTRV
jgi:hypothetical protein